MHKLIISNMGSLHSPKFLFTIFYKGKIYKIKFIHNFNLLNSIFWKARDYHLKDHNQLFSKSIFIKNTIFSKIHYM